MASSHTLCVKTFSEGDMYYIETSNLIYSANHLTGLCMVRLLKGVIFIFCYSLLLTFATRSKIKSY